jgi:2,3-bisphosphoglycerate-dependent phosphoglycerate mutase
VTAADSTRAESASFPQQRFQPPPEATEIVLVRHGQSQPYVDGQLFELTDGHGDPPLSPQGREQAPDGRDRRSARC